MHCPSLSLVKGQVAVAVAVAVAVHVKVKEPVKVDRHSGKATS